jgi:hypothetical protein
MQQVCLRWDLRCVVQLRLVKVALKQDFGKVKMSSLTMPSLVDIQCSAKYGTFYLFMAMQNVKDEAKSFDPY